MDFRKKDTEWPGTGCSKIVGLTALVIVGLCTLGGWLLS